MITAARPPASIGFRVVSRMMDAVARGLGWRWHTTGVEHIPAAGGAVVTWNHHSELDFMASACEVYMRTGRPVRILATARLWEVAPLRWLLQLVDAIPVGTASSSGRTEGLQGAVDALREGHLVLVAPEGRITPSLELLPFRTGAARMAQQAGVPIIPSAAWGTQRVWTVGHRNLRALFRLTVSSVFAEPVRVGPEDDVVAVTERLQHVTSHLLDAVRRAYPDGPAALA